MEPAEYDRMDAVEDRMWWYRAAHANMLDALLGSSPPPGSSLLDAGCGTGGLLRRVVAVAPERRPVGVDIFEPAAATARNKSGCAVAVASANCLPFRDASFGTIFSVDVICHRNVDPARALGEARRCLMEGGSLIINVPAYQWMASFHDREVHNARRFDRAGLTRLLAGAGFSRFRTTYWNSILFPLMVLHRKLPAREASRSDVGEFSPLANRVFGGIMAAERAGMRFGLRYPFGGSLLAVATK
jgi:ubiquinone/menaquinone biosynthesis C-methylase UbiE